MKALFNLFLIASVLFGCLGTASPVQAAAAVTPVPTQPPDEGSPAETPTPTSTAPPEATATVPPATPTETTTTAPTETLTETAPAPALTETPTVAATATQTPAPTSTATPTEPTIPESPQLALTSDLDYAVSGGEITTSWSFQGLAANLNLLFILPEGFTPKSGMPGDYDPQNRTLRLALAEAGQVTWEIAPDARGPYTFTVQALRRDQVAASAQLTIDEAAEAEIGPTGGTAASPDRRIQVTFPDGAIDQPVRARVRAFARCAEDAQFTQRAAIRDRRQRDSRPGARPPFSQTPVHPGQLRPGRDPRRGSQPDAVLLRRSPVHLGPAPRPGGFGRPHPHRLVGPPVRLRLQHPELGSRPPALAEGLPGLALHRGRRLLLPHPGPAWPGRPAAQPGAELQQPGGRQRQLQDPGFVGRDGLVAGDAEHHPQHERDDLFPGR